MINEKTGLQLREVVIASIMLALVAWVVRCFWVGSNDTELSKAREKLLAIDPEIKVMASQAAPVPGFTIFRTNKGDLVISNTGDVLVRGTFEDLETGRDLINIQREPLPFVGHNREGHVTGRAIPKPLQQAKTRLEMAGVAGLAELAAPSEEVRGGLAARLAALKAQAEGGDKPADAGSAGGAASDQARAVPVQQAQGLPPPGAIPKVGFDNSGKPVSAKQKRQQVKAIMANLPANWMMVYEAPNATSSITVLTDPTCPYCHRLHNAIGELNAAGITVRYLFYPRYLGAGEQDPRAKELVSKINAAWCSSEPKQALDILFSGGNAGRACNELPEGDARPRDPAVDHYTLGQILGVNGTPHIIHESGEAWVGFGSAKTLIQDVKNAESSARAQ